MGIDFLPIKGLVQDCGNSSANASELPQSCAKPSMWYSFISVFRMTITALTYLSRLPWIFPWSPLTVCEAPGNIQGNSVALLSLSAPRTTPTCCTQPSMVDPTRCWSLRMNSGITASCWDHSEKHSDCGSASARWCQSVCFGTTQAYPRSSSRWEQILLSYRWVSARKM